MTAPPARPALVALVDGVRAYGRAIVEWLVLGVLVGIAAGLATGIFLLSLAAVTAFRDAHDTIVYLLPVAGIGIGLAYDRWGGTAKGGNNLVIDAIHETSPKVPLRMAPMVLLGTLATHLFGGSAGREGTAVQMGASLGDEIARRLRLDVLAREGVLAAGIAGGFGAAFGTPFAGTVFALEVLMVGRMEYHTLLPAITSAMVADLVTRAMGVVHVPYPMIAGQALTVVLFLEWILLGAVVAVVTIAFVEGTHRLRRWLEGRVPWLPIRMALGGVVIIVLWRLVGTDIYLGLGVPTIVGSFSDPNLPLEAFALKALFTAVTLGCGFIGGEVTPLLFVGAALGSAYGRVMGIPIELAAGVGLVAVFGAAANTPIALSIMAVELVGGAALPHAAVVTVVAYLLTGHRGIYPSQRILRAKHGGRPIEAAVKLREIGPARQRAMEAASRLAPPGRR